MPVSPSLQQKALDKDIYRVNPDLFGPWREVEELISRGHSPFSESKLDLRRDLELLTNSCRHCYNSHSEAANRDE